MYWHRGKRGGGFKNLIFVHIARDYRPIYKLLEKGGKVAMSSLLIEVDRGEGGGGLPDNG